jgi:hypothetical protein
MVHQEKVEQVYVPLILFNRGGYPNVFLTIIGLKFPFRGDFKLIGVILGFENINVKEAIHQKMIDLGDLTLMLKPQIMNDRPVL